MEYFDIIDEDGRSLGFSKERSLVHAEGDWHKGVHVWILCGDKVLLQKRAPKKDSFPNKYDVSCGGHVSAGDTYENTAVRELKEELGIDISMNDLGFVEEIKHFTEDAPRNFINREILGVYALRLNVDLDSLVLQEEEVSEVRLFTIGEMRALLEKEPNLFTPCVSHKVVDMLEKLISKC